MLTDTAREPDEKENGEEEDEAATIELLNSPLPPFGLSNKELSFITPFSFPPKSPPQSPFLRT